MKADKAIKLSNQQKIVLRAMVKGMRLFTINGYNSKVGTSHSQMIVSFPTLWKLISLGMVIKGKDDYMSHRLPDY